MTSLPRTTLPRGEATRHGRDARATGLCLALCTVLACISASARGLRTIETKHYTLHTDVEPGFAEELAIRLDGMYREYARRLSDFAPTAGRTKSQVYVYERQADYAQLTGSRFPNTGGVFVPGKDLLAAFLEGQGRETLRRTLQHEAFHQFAHAVISPDMPPWLNEGLAQVFEEGIWTGDRFLLGQVPPHRIRQLREDMRGKRLIAFETLLKYTDEQWAANMSDRATAGVQYNQAWAMAHFLIYATDDSGQPRYRNRLLTMLKTLHNGSKPESAFRSSFSDNTRGFQDRFVDWAISVGPTPEAAYVENMTVLGDMLTAMNKEGLRFDSVEDFKRKLTAGRYRLTYTRGQITWSTAGDPGIYFNDLENRPMGADRLFFDRRNAARIPDMMCRAIKGIQFRARTSADGQKMDTEVLVESR